jgi:hypothetical protein
MKRLVWPSGGIKLKNMITIKRPRYENILSINGRWLHSSEHLLICMLPFCGVA